MIGQFLLPCFFITMALDMLSGKFARNRPPISATLTLAPSMEPPMINDSGMPSSAMPSQMASATLPPSRCSRCAA